MKPVRILELLKQLVHNSQADRDEIARQHLQISDLRSTVCGLQAIHATPRTATTVSMSPDSVSRLDLSPSLPRYNVLPISMIYGKTSHRWHQTLIPRRRQHQNCRRRE